tara:strand:+ start:511 stop:690 length:180 start_codon:yes stop_codon:yes gene_type:complete
MEIKNSKIVKLKKNNKINCPYCQKKSVEPHTPFCSKKCSDLDLIEWLSFDETREVFKEK